LTIAIKKSILNSNDDNCKNKIKVIGIEIQLQMSLKEYHNLQNEVK